MLTPTGLISARKPGDSWPGGPNRTRQSAARRALVLRSEVCVSLNGVTGIPGASGGKDSDPRMLAKTNNSLLMACECSLGDGARFGNDTEDRTQPRKTLRGSLHLG